MMTIDEIWVKAADDALKKNGIVFDNSYLKCYRGYISTFGTAIVQSGLVAASVFYELDDKKAKGNRYAVILSVIDLLVTLGKMRINPNDVRRLSYYALTHQEDKYLLVSWVDKAVAYLKFALRLYKEIDDGTSNKETKEYGSKKKYEAPTISGRETTGILNENEFKDKYLHVSNNKNANISWLFYRDFYKDFTYDKHNIYIRKRNGSRGQKQGTEQELNFKKRTMFICNSIFTDDHQQRNLALLSALPGEEFKLQTLYPGLVIGSGLNHSSGENHDVKMGFLFDYTTGLPYIPGSSIKGMLRSMFPMKKNNSKQENNAQYIAERTDYLNSVLKKEYTTE